MVVLVCFEVALWIIGYRPYFNHDYKVEASPKNAFVGHPTLGVFNNPGQYRITLNDKIEFETTHNLKGQRVVSKSEVHTKKGGVAFLGCSFTYGYGVNSDETFVSLLQQKFPQWNLSNLGTPGFGTVQSYLQLNELVKNDSVKAVVLCFSDFHLKRNVMSQVYRSDLKIGFKNSSTDVDARMQEAKFPFLSGELIVDKPFDVEWVKWQDLYSNYYLRNYLATVNWLQNNVNKFKDRKLNSVKISEVLISKMAEICKKNNIAFKVVCLNSSAEVRKIEGIRSNWKSVNFDFKHKRYTNLPYDSHPNALGHALIAKRIRPFLSQMLNDCE